MRPMFARKRLRRAHRVLTARVADALAVVRVVPPRRLRPDGRFPVRFRKASSRRSRRRRCRRKPRTTRSWRSGTRSTSKRIEVEGFRERDGLREPPRTAEQRFADALNEGSPELVAGKSYNGYYYDGTLFWGADPLSFAWKNITHWLKH